MTSTQCTYMYMYTGHKYWLARTHSLTKPECGVIPATAHSFPNLRQVMWISRCGKPVSVCDGSDSDCWLMERGYITCVGECVHGGCNGHLYNPPPLSRVPVAQHKHHESQHQTLRSLWGAQTRQNQASLRLPRNTLHLLFSSFPSFRLC